MKKRIISIASLIFVFIMLFSVPASAKSYQTYTYALDGFALYSPDAYVPEGNTSRSFGFLRAFLSDVLSSSPIYAESIEVFPSGTYASGEYKAKPLSEYV